MAPSASTIAADDLSQEAPDYSSANVPKHRFPTMLVLPPEVDGVKLLPAILQPPGGGTSSGLTVGEELSTGVGEVRRGCRRGRRVLPGRMRFLVALEARRKGCEKLARPAVASSASRLDSLAKWMASPGSGRGGPTASAVKDRRRPLDADDPRNRAPCAL